MASAAITLPRATPWRLASWRREAAVRWAPRLAFAAPLAILSIIVDQRGFVSAPNATLELHGHLARSSGVAGLGWAYPPIPTFLASILPGGALALALVSSLLAGVAMASLWDRLAHRNVPLPLSIALLASLACVPGVLYGATQDLAAFAGLAFLIVALDGFTRFIGDRDTRGGFQAGLMLAFAFGCDPIALVYAAALAAAAPLLAHARFRSEPDAAVATASVLIFPVAAAAAAWAFLEWRFTGSAFGTVIDQGTLFHFSDGVVHGLGIAVRDTVSTALHVPVYLAVGALLYLRKPIAVAGYAVPLVGLVAAEWIGLQYSSVTAFMLLAAVAIVTAPARPGRNAGRLLFGVAVLQIVLGIVATSHTAEVHRFLDLLR
jgi:hypothetical protein